MTKEKMETITHLGDGVYCEYDGYGYILRANHHTEEGCTDRVYIDPDVYQRLKEFVVYIESFKRLKSAKDE